MNRKELEGLTVDALRKEARTRGLSGVSGMRRDQLIDALVKLQGRQGTGSLIGRAKKLVKKATDKLRTSPPESKAAASQSKAAPTKASPRPTPSVSPTTGKATAGKAPS